MLNGSRLYPWNYTLPDLKNFMNGSELPSVHDLLGITTTTTEVSNVNKPVFPLNLTFWNNMPWKGNYSHASSSVLPDLFADDSVDEHTGRHGSRDYHQGRHSSRLDPSSVESMGRVHFVSGTSDGVAQMVIPASIGTVVHHVTPSITMNFSLVTQESNNLLDGNGYFGNGTGSLNDTDFNAASLSTAGTIVTSVILGIMILTTVIGNVFVIAAILLERNLQQVANFLIVSLAVADLMVACLVMPLGAVYEISQEWVLGPELCDMWTSSDVLCCTASILHLVAIALDRFWAVTQVDYIQARRNGKRIGIMILLIWMTAVIVSMAPFFGWKDPDYLHRVNEQKKCLVSQDLAYQIFATLATFYVPLTAILILYWRIFQTARKRLHKRPGKNNITRSLSLRSKSKLKKKNKKKKDGQTAKSNGLSQQQETTAFTTEASGNIMASSPTPFSDNLSTLAENMEGTNPVLSQISVSGAQEASLKESLVLRSAHNVLMTQNSIKGNVGTINANCAVMQRSTIGGHPITSMSAISADNICDCTTQDKKQCGINGDRNQRTLLRCSQNIIPPFEYRTAGHYVVHQNYYGDSTVISAEPAYRSASLPFYPGQNFGEDHTPIYKHESTNTSTRSLYKHESTNTDSIYDFQLTSTYDNLSPTYTRKHFDETTNTMVDSSYIIEPTHRGTSFPNEATLVPESTYNDSPGPIINQIGFLNYPAPEDGIIQCNTFSLPTLGLSDTQLRSSVIDDKGSTSAVPSASSQEAEASSNLELTLPKEPSCPCQNYASNVSLASTIKTSEAVSPQHQHHPKKTKKESLDAKREKKAAKTLAIITGAFVVCWLPFFVIALLMPVCPSCWMSDAMFSFFLWLGYFNSTLNPIIYTIFSPEFREAFKRILCGRKNQRYRPGKFR